MLFSRIHHVTTSLIEISIEDSLAVVSTIHGIVLWVTIHIVSPIIIVHLHWILFTLLTINCHTVLQVANTNSKNYVQTIRKLNRVEELALLQHFEIAAQGQ